MDKLLFATNNQHKTDEVIEILSGYKHFNFQIVNSSHFTKEKLEVDEYGKNYFENAFIKAEAFFNKFGIPCIADDSGLEVDQLNGLPGVNSARYAGEQSNDKLNREKLITELDFSQDDILKARFICVICYNDGTNTSFFEGKVEGRITNLEMGKGGFGYDPIFIPDGYEQTFAQLDQSIKNQISHRANALKLLVEFFD